MVHTDITKNGDKITLRFAAWRGAGLLPKSHKRSTNFKQTQICQTKQQTPHLAKLLLN